MLATGPAKRLTVFLCERETRKHRSVAREIVRRAQAAGLAGATMFVGIEGYGASRHLHTTRLLTMSDDLPLCVVVIDTVQAIERFADQLEDLIAGDLVTIEDVEVVRAGGQSGAGAW